MSLLAPAPQSIGKVLDAGFKLFRAAFGKIFGVVAVLSVIAYLPAVFFAQAQLQPGYAAQHPGVVLTGVLLALWQIAVISLMAAYVVLQLDDLAEQRTLLSAGPALARARTRWLRVFGGTLYTGLLIGLAFLLLIIPGIMLGISLAFTILLIVIDDMSIGAAVKASRRLVSGYWWRTAGVISVVAVLVFAIMATLGFLVAIIVAANHVAMAPLAASSVQRVPVVIKLLSAIGNVVSSALIYPLNIAILLVMFRDLQVRKFGSDLAARIDQSV